MTKMVYGTGFISYKLTSPYLTYHLSEVGLTMMPPTSPKMYSKSKKLRSTWMDGAGKDPSLRMQKHECLQNNFMVPPPCGENGTSPHC